VAFQYLKGAYKQEGEQLLTWSNCDRTRGNDFKLKDGKFMLNVRKRFFAQRVGRCWHCCPELWVLYPWRYTVPWMGP